MPGFPYNRNGVDAKKVDLRKKKKIASEYAHLKVKNAVYLNKAIRKLKSRQGAHVLFSDVLGGNVGNSEIAVHRDAGSIHTTGKSKSQIGVLGMAQASDPIVIYPNVGTRYPDLKGASGLVKNPPYTSATPIFRTSGESGRVAVSSAPAELQGIYTAFDDGTVLRIILRSNLRASQRKIEVEIRHDQLSAINAINGLTAIPPDRELAGTLRSLRRMLDRREIRSAKYAPGDANLADALTKCTSGNDLFYLMEYNKCARKAPGEIRDNVKRAVPGKQYLFLHDVRKKIAPGGRN